MMRLACSFSIKTSLFKGVARAAVRFLWVVTFLAMLELIRLHQVRVAQTDNFGEIHINRVVDNDIELLNSVPAVASVPGSTQN